MMAPIFSWSTLTDTTLGANSEMSSAGLERVFSMMPRMCILPRLAWSRAFVRISVETEEILMSIWKAVMPSFVPATLKSMSPRWSSSPRMSESTAKRFSSVMRPMAMPATGLRIGTPAFIRESEEPQTVAMEDDPLDSRTSETTRMVYGNFSLGGSMALMARQARWPCPISRLPVPRRPVSPTEYGGKL